MNRPHFRRHPRPIDPNPEYSRLDRLDGLPRAHRAPCTDGDVCGEPAHCPPEPNPRLAWLAEQHRRLDGLRALYTKPLRASGGTVVTDGVHFTAALGERIYPFDGPYTRYDVELPDVLAAEAGGWAGGDLPAIPPVPWADLVTHDTTCEAEVGGDLAAMAAPGDWPVWDYGEGYEIEPEERAVARPSHRPRHAHPPTPPVDEADVEALAGLVDEAGIRVVPNASSRLIARRMLATGRVSVTP